MLWFVWQFFGIAAVPYALRRLDEAIASSRGDHRPLHRPYFTSAGAFVGSIAGVVALIVALVASDLKLPALGGDVVIVPVMALGAWLGARIAARPRGAGGGVHRLRRPLLPSRAQDHRRRLAGCHGGARRGGGGRRAAPRRPGARDRPARHGGGRARARGRDRARRAGRARGLSRGASRSAGRSATSARGATPCARRPWAARTSARRPSTATTWRRARPPGATAEERIGAALALRELDDAGATRVRVAAESAVDPGLREVLRAVADGSVDEAAVREAARG